MTKTVALLTLSDISTLQGSTETVYVAEWLADEYDLHVYSPHDPNLEAATYHAIPNPTLIPLLVLINILLPLVFVYHTWKHDYDVAYTYKCFIIPAVVVASLMDASWVADFRTKPTAQEKEFNKHNPFYAVIKFYLLMYDSLYRATLYRADAIITLSDPIRKHLEKAYDIPPEVINIVPLGVDTELFQPPPDRDGDTDTIDLVYVGSIVNRRGFDICFAALAHPGLKVDIHLHLIGDGDDEYIRELKSYARSGGIDQRITWYGYVDHNDLPDLLSEMDAALSPLPPYDSYQVSSPAKLYEYLSMGLPVVCTDIRPHRQALEEGQTGFFADPGSPDSFVSAFNELNDISPAKWESIRSQTRHVAKKNDWSVRLDTVREVIENVAR